MARIAQHLYSDMMEALARERQHGREEERAKIVAWLRESADQIIGNTLTGGYDVGQCVMAANAIEIAAGDIKAGEHLK